MLVNRLRRAAIDTDEPKLRRISPRLSYVAEVASSKTPTPCTGMRQHPRWYCRAILEATTTITDPHSDPKEFAAAYLKKSPLFTRSPSGLAALATEAYIAAEATLATAFVETVVDSNEDFLVIFKGPLGKEPLKKFMEELSSTATYEILVAYDARDYEEGIVSDLTILKGVPKPKKEKPKSKNPLDRAKEDDGFSQLPPTATPSFHVQEREEKPQSHKDPNGLWCIYEGIVQSGPYSASKWIVEFIVPEGHFRYSIDSDLTEDVEEAMEAYAYSVEGSAFVAASLCDLCENEGVEVGTVNGYLEEGVSFVESLLAVASTKEPIDWSATAGGEAFKQVGVNSKVLAAMLGSPAPLNPMNALHPTESPVAPSVPDQDPIFRNPGEGDKDSGEVCEGAVRIVAKRADAAEVDWALTKAGYVVKPFKSADGNVYWDLNLPDDPAKRRVEKAIRVLGAKAQFMVVEGVLRPEIDDVSTVAAALAALHEKKDPKEDDDEDDHMEDPMFYRDDLQLFYDSKLLQGLASFQAENETKRRFKLKKLIVTPTGEVRSPGIVDRPMASKIQRPEDVSLGMEIEQTGRDAEQAEIDKAAAKADAAVNAKEAGLDPDDVLPKDEEPVKESTMPLFVVERFGKDGFRTLSGPYSDLDAASAALAEHAATSSLILAVIPAEGPKHAEQQWHAQVKTLDGRVPFVESLTEAKRVGFICPKCGSKNTSIRERHADTGMDCMEFRCADCKHSTEDLDTVESYNWDDGKEEYESKLARLRARRGEPDGTENYLRAVFGLDEALQDGSFPFAIDVAGTLSVPHVDIVSTFGESDSPERHGSIAWLLEATDLFVTLTRDGETPHEHRVDITPEQAETILQGGKVVVTSSEDEGHTHAVKFYKRDDDLFVEVSDAHGHTHGVA